MEDAYIDKWFAQVRKIVAGRVPGIFYITLPIRVPEDADAEQFAEALIKTIRANETAIVREGQHGRMLRFPVAGIEIWISLLPLNTGGSDVELSRIIPDMSEFPARVRICLDAKSPKLKPYSDAGMETWIVIFNTMGMAMSPLDAERIVEQECGLFHAHVTHIVPVIGYPPDPPNDAIVWVVR